MKKLYSFSFGHMIVYFGVQETAGNQSGTRLVGFCNVERVDATLCTHYRKLNINTEIDCCTKSS